MQLFVRGIEQNYALTFEGLARAQEVLDRIADVEGLAEVSVLVGGRPLEDDDVVGRSLNLATVDVCVPLRGGKVTIISLCLNLN